MKKNLLLSCALAFASWSAYGQIATYVLEPPELEGPLEFVIADDWGNQPDMNDPANRVEAYAAIVDDGTENSDLGCENLVNADDLTGKVAVVWRGTCEFGLKALNAQTAGAIGVVIVNNAPGAPVGMAGGDNGINVTVPVVMISQDAGAMLRDQIEAGNVKLLIGSVLGMFPSNLSVNKNNVLIPTTAARPQEISADAGAFSVELGAWVYNWGSEPASNAKLNGQVVRGTSTLYNETVNSTQVVNPGDSVYIALPTFSQDSYTGRYEITYTTSDGDLEDYFEDDNSYATSLTVDSILSYSPLDADGMPTQDAFYRPADGGSFEICAHFIDPHASRLRAEGIYTAMSMNADDGVLTGLQVNASMSEWNDDITIPDDIFLDDVETVMNGVFVYEADLNSELIFVPFFEPMPMVDNQRYLFCVGANSDLPFIGHSTTVNYQMTQDQTSTLQTVLHIGDSWSLGWNTGETPALGILMTDIFSGIQEMKYVDLTPYPNPTTSSISIPMQGMSGKASVEVFDTKGAKVLDRQVTVGGNNILTMDLGNLQNGQYVFHVLFDNGYRSNFNVVLAH